MKKKVWKIVKIILTIVILIAILIGFRSCCVYQNQLRMDMLIERPNSEIVKVRTNHGSILTTYNTVGYMDSNDIESFINKTLDKNVKIYNPYTEDEYVLVTVDAITSITKLSEEEFVANYSPNS